MGNDSDVLFNLKILVWSYPLLLTWMGNFAKYFLRGKRPVKYVNMYNDYWGLKFAY